MINPLKVGTLGIISKNPLNIASDGFLYVSTGIVFYKKRPGPYFMANPASVSIADSVLGGFNSQTDYTSANQKSTALPGVNRK
jgi:hypothetical protein